jgi:hypothetical protein
VEIKTALKFALSVTTDPAMRDQLKTGYISLGDFQELSDREIRALQLWNNALSRNTSAADLAKTMSAEGLPL